ncbi:MAG: hypothetical protein IJN13_04350 [Bacilli bacterium]|nr:hypothetical protein [Bacilli bacterium]MBQ7031582.1 hypothetical protein [Bacilli bacterium]
MNKNITIKPKNCIEYKCEKGKFVGKYVVRHVDFVLTSDDPNALPITYEKRREIAKAIVEYLNSKI